MKTPDNNTVCKIVIGYRSYHNNQRERVSYYRRVCKEFGIDVSDFVSVGSVGKIRNLIVTSAQNVLNIAFTNLLIQEGVIVFGEILPRAFSSDEVRAVSVSESGFIQVVNQRTGKKITLGALYKKAGILEELLTKRGLTPKFEYT
jgi:hypothetical protein